MKKFSLLALYSYMALLSCSTQLVAQSVIHDVGVQQAVYDKFMDSSVLIYREGAIMHGLTETEIETALDTGRFYMGPEIYESDPAMRTRTGTGVILGHRDGLRSTQQTIRPAAPGITPLEGRQPVFQVELNFSVPGGWEAVYEEYQDLNRVHLRKTVDRRPVKGGLHPILSIANAFGQETSLIQSSENGVITIESADFQLIFHYDSASLTDSLALPAVFVTGIASQALSAVSCYRKHRNVAGNSLGHSGTGSDCPDGFFLHREDGKVHYYPNQPAVMPALIRISNENSSEIGMGSGWRVVTEFSADNRPIAFLLYYDDHFQPEAGIFYGAGNRTEDKIIRHMHYY
ncbi:MAG: hypothetical protein ACR2PT_04085 [Endozoicomonas sp.]